MRPRLSWLIAGAVVAVGLFAALDALRSSGEEPRPAEASSTGAITTTQTEGDAELESFSLLQTRRVVKLIPGRVTTNERFPIAVTFTVPPGWYGYQKGSSFVIGKTRARTMAVTRDVSFGGIAVDILDHRLADALGEVETIPGVRVLDSAPVRIGDYSGRRFGLEARQPGPLRELLGVSGVFFLGEPGEQLILLGVGRKTLLIRWGSDGGDPERLEVDRILSSFRLTTPEQEIERIGNKWARLFAAGRTCNRFMAQPACEWLVCKRVGGGSIKDCTPLSSEVQRSFAGAVVEDVAIKGQRAAARFSNGEAVRFSGFGADWGVLRVGAGRELFE
jgi:hypothetical protein